MQRILIVEDSKTICSYLTYKLKSELGLETDAVHSMRDAAYHLSYQSDYLLAILDLNLPDAPEGEIVDLLLSKNISSIVLTATIDNQLRNTLLGKGIMDYVLKNRDAVHQVVELVKRLQRNKEITLLIVDDSGIYRKIIRSFLGTYGFKFLEAKNGPEALEIIKSTPDLGLVITDYEMPGMDGATLCTKIRDIKTRNELPIIGISSFEDKLLSAKIIKSGANDFLPKPFQREELACRVIQNLETTEYIEMINTSLQTISEMNARMKRDLEAAAKLQRSLLPMTPPQARGAHLAMVFKPCDELAGDTFNMFPLPGNRLALYVLDVSGHGVPAALLSVSLCRLLSPDPQRSTILVEESEDGEDLHILPPAEVCQRLNEQFPIDMESFQYFTIVYGILECDTGQFTFTAAGHPGPVHLNNDRTVTAYPTNTMAIGFAPDMAREQTTIRLQRGDRLFFYTDGIIEARNAAAQEYSLERLSQQVLALADVPLHAALEALFADVSDWTGASFADDITLCALEFTGE